MAMSIAIASVHQTVSTFLATTSTTTLLTAPVVLLVTHHVLTTAYNLYLHPLKGFPGPRTCAASYWPYWLGHLKLRWHLQSKKLHDEYGDVVRIAPDRLDFAGAQAWRDINGYEAMGTITPKIEKDYNFYEAIKPPIPTILSARAAAHARCRRTMAHAFSTTALKGQEPIMQKHVDELMSALRTASTPQIKYRDEPDASKADSGSSARVDINEWVQKAVFDMIGDLALGSDFGLLKGAVAKLTSGAAATSTAPSTDATTGTSSTIANTESSDPASKTKKPSRPIDEAMAALRPASAIIGLASHGGWRVLFRTITALTMKVVRDELSGTLLTKLKARLKVVKENADIDGDTEHAEEKEGSSDVRKDLAYYLIEKSRSEGAGPKMTEDEMEVNLLILLVAGAETTAVLVAVAIWLLLLHPAQLKPLVALLRTTFHTADNITLDQLTSDSPIALNLDAIISETMRLFPPQPITLPRVTRTDCVISGHVVPKGTIVGVDPYTSARSAKTWARANEFRPERWLAGHEEFEGDVKGASQPFSVGPRDCVGRRVALFESKLILARFFHTFDASLLPESRAWISRSSTGTGNHVEMEAMPELELLNSSWARPPLLVHLFAAEAN